MCAPARVFVYFVFPGTKTKGFSFEILTAVDAASTLIRKKQSFHTAEKIGRTAAKMAAALRLNTPDSNLPFLSA